MAVGAVGLAALAHARLAPRAQEPAPAQSGTAEAPAVVSAALALIPLDGTPDAPISWEFETSDAEAPEAVLAARRFMALRILWESSAEPAPLAEVLPYLETGGDLSADQVAWRAVGFQSDPVVGPAWARLVEVTRRSPSEAEVGVCVDLRWRHPRSSPATMPETKDAAALYQAEVRRGATSGPAQWRIYDWRGARSADFTGRQREECAAWATH